MLLDFVNKIWGCPRVLWDRLVAITPQKTHVVSTGTQENRWKMFTAKVEQGEALKMLTAASCSFCAIAVFFVQFKLSVTEVICVTSLERKLEIVFSVNQPVNQNNSCHLLFSFYLPVIKMLPSDNLLTLRYLLSKRPGKSKIVKVKPFFRR